MNDREKKKDCCDDICPFCSELIRSLYLFEEEYLLAPKEHYAQTVRMELILDRKNHQTGGDDE